MEMLLYVEGMPTEALRAGIRWEWETFPEYLDAVERCAPGDQRRRLRRPLGGALLRHGRRRRRARRDRRRAGAHAGRRARGDARRRDRLLDLGVADALLRQRRAGAEPRRAARRDPRPRRRARRVRPRHRRGRAAAPDRRAPTTSSPISTSTSRWRAPRGRPVTWAPLLANPFDPSGALRIIEAAAAAQRAGAVVYPQVGCRPLEVRICFDTAGIAIANNPFWKPILELPQAGAPRAPAPAARSATSCAQMSSRRRLRRRARPELAAHLPALLAAAAARAARSIAASPRSSPARGGDPVDTLLDLALESDLDCQFGIPIMNTDEDVVGQLLRHPAGIIALSDAGAHVDTLADQGFTTTLLAHWVRELGVAAARGSGAPASPACRRRSTACASAARCATGWRPTSSLFDADPHRPASAPSSCTICPAARRDSSSARSASSTCIVNGELLVERGAQTDARSGQCAARARLRATLP